MLGFSLLTIRIRGALVAPPPRPRNRAAVRADQRYPYSVGPSSWRGGCGPGTIPAMSGSSAESASRVGFCAARSARRCALVRWRSLRASSFLRLLTEGRGLLKRSTPVLSLYAPELNLLQPECISDWPMLPGPLDHFSLVSHRAQSSHLLP